MDVWDDARKLGTRMQSLGWMQRGSYPHDREGFKQCDALHKWSRFYQSRNQVNLVHMCWFACGTEIIVEGLRAVPLAHNFAFLLPTNTITLW